MFEINEGAIFISDAHDNANKKHFLNFLKALKNGDIELPSQLFLMGDMFDLLTCTAYTQMFYKEQIDLLNELSNDIDIFYFEGNHDFNLSEIFPKIKVFPINLQPQLFIADRQKISLAHGDIFLSLTETICLRALRNKVLLKFLDFLDKKIDYKISKILLKTQENKFLDYKIPNFKEIINKKIKHYNNDFIIEGHYHQGVNFYINDKYYVNLPCFACEQRYFVVKYDNEIKFQIIRSPNV